MYGFIQNFKNGLAFFVLHPLKSKGQFIDVIANFLIGFIILDKIFINQ